MGLLLVKTFRSRFELCVVVESNEAKFLSSPSLGGRDRGDPHEIHCKDTASQIPMMMGVRHSVIFVGGHCVQHTVTRIHQNARRPSRSGQEQHFRAAKLFSAGRNPRRCSAVPGVANKPSLCSSRQEQNRARSQACRTGGHAFGARYTACSRIPGNGVYRVVSQKYDQQTQPMETSPVEALAKESPSHAW